MIGDKLERRNRLNSSLILEKTPGERNFAAQVDHLLSRIKAPEYRQLCSECLLSLMAFVEANPEVRFEDDLALDVVIGHAVQGGLAAEPSLFVRDPATRNTRPRPGGSFIGPHPVTAAAGKSRRCGNWPNSKDWCNPSESPQIGAHRGAPVSGCSTACSIRSASLRAREA